MGGNAVAKITGKQGERLPADKYWELSEKIDHNLSWSFHQRHLVRSYTAKTDFGDQDWLIGIGAGKFQNLKSTLAIKFGIPENHVIKNTNVYSMLIDDFQVDITATAPDYFDCCGFYLDDSPFGNSVGKLYHKFGASYGIDGLYYTLRDNFNTHKLGRINISVDNEKICQFLGLDYARKNRGFDTERDIFNFITTSKYFDHRIFAWDAMNHRARIRDRKRPDYSRMLDYFNCKFKDRIYDFPIKTDGVQILDKFFPESKLIQKINELKEKEAARKGNAMKFNGILVMEWTGTKGKKLGTIIHGFRFWVVGLYASSFENYLQENSMATIKNQFLSWYYGVYTGEDLDFYRCLR